MHKMVATYLGSAQINDSIEYEALTLGKILLIYITPKISMYIQDELEFLAMQGKLELIAINEAHCLSEYGHDFHPEFCMICTVL